MTTGFQTQQQTFGHIMKTAAKPQAVGSQLKPDQGGRDVAVPVEKRTFSERRSDR